MTEFSVGLMGLRYAQRHKIPVISNYSTNFSNYTDYYKIEVLKIGVSTYMNWFHNQCLLTTCPSKDAQQALLNYGVMRTAIFSRGIDSNKFSPLFRNDKLRESFGLKNKVTFLYVGRIAPEKDLDLIRQAYAKIQELFPEQTALVVAGDGPLLDNCRQTFPKDTVFTGFKKSRELSEIYASCDIFVMPSSTETFGNVVLEAMASGLAVIGADAGGVGENISHMNNGLHFISKSADSLTSALETLMTQAVLRKQLQNHARSTALVRDWSKVFASLIHFMKAPWIVI